MAATNTWLQSQLDRAQSRLETLDPVTPVRREDGLSALRASPYNDMTTEAVRRAVLVEMKRNYSEVMQ